MAGEKIGRFYEFLIVVAIEDALEQAGKSLTVHWNPLRGDLMVQPDVIVGELADPVTLILATRSGSRRDWHKKFWRNIGELLDVRRVHPRTGIASVALGTELKEELVVAQAALVDTSVFPSRNHRTNLENWAEPLADRCPVGEDEARVYAKRAIRKAPKPIQDTLSAIGAKVVRDSSSPSKGWKPVVEWLSSRDTKAEEAAEQWEVPGNFRRGLAKLLAVGRPGIVLKGIDQRTKKITPELARAFITNGWANRSLRGAHISDPEILHVLDGVDREAVTSLLEASTSEELRTIRADIESTEFLESTSAFLKKNAPKLTDRNWLAQALSESLADNSLGGKLCAPPANVAGCWLFRALMAHIKCATGRKQGYGYEQLIGDVRRIAGDADLCRDLQSSGATQVQIEKAGTTDSLRRKLVDWVSGLRDTELSKWQVELVAAALAFRFARFNSSELVRAAGEVADFIRRVTYEDRIAPYRYFDPMSVWIKKVLTDAAIHFVHQPRHLSLVSDLSPGERKIGTTPVILADRTLIHWKSAHGSANTGHKTKELCGRAFSLKHRLSEEPNKIENAAGVERLILVLDGTFDANNVRNLVRAGWDNVISPLQISQLPGILSGSKSS